MRRSVLGTILLIGMTIGCLNCTSIVEEAQRKKDADENRRLEQERAKLQQQTDRNRYPSEKAYRKAYKQLLDRYAKLADENIDSALYQYLYGYLLVNHTKKVRQYTRCLKIKSDHFWCLVGRGQVYANWGVENFARKDFAKAKELRPQSIEPLIGMATLAFRKRQNGKAIQLYQQVLQRQPKNKEALYSLALLYDRQQRWSEAISYYERVLKIDPKDFATQQALARIHLRLKQYPQAAEALEKAIALRAKFRLIVQLAGLYETQLANPAKALNLYDQASKLPQAHFHTFYRLGVLRSQQGEHSQAIEALRKAVRLRNDNPDAFYQLGRLYTNQGNYKEAIPVLWKSLRLDGKNVEVREALAKAMVQTQQFSDALRQYQQILSLQPKNQRVRGEMNQLLNRLGLTNDTFTARNNQQVIRKGEKIIYRCYQTRLKQKPKLKGVVAVSMIIASDGKVERVGINPSKTTLDDALIHTCVKWTFRRAIFPFIKTRSRLRYAVKLR